jgi:hypothetical protein
LLPGSPAIDRGNSFGLTTDQRGHRRPVDYSAIPNPDGGDGSDIGAVEADVPLLTIEDLPPNHVLLYWDTNFTGYIVETTSTATDSNSWLKFPDLPSFATNRYQVTSSRIRPEQFYRLRLFP